MSASCPHDKRTDCGLEERRGEESREEIQPAAPVPTSEPAKPSRSRDALRTSWTASGGWHGITDADRLEWLQAFPGAVLERELAKATAWLKANPKRAGRRNWRRFLVNWLQRCQEKGGTDREPGRRPEDVDRKAAVERTAKAFAGARPAPYRRPAEVVALAESLKVREG